jgi:hypothetical protein
MNVIYQFWDGNVRPSCRAGVENMKAYADFIGAEYVFEENPQWIKSIGLDFGNYSAHFGAFKPLWNKAYLKYDNILFCDTDVFAVDGIKQNIFEQFDADVGICEEPFQPPQRTITLGRITTQQDNLWASTLEKAYSFTMPRTEDKLVKVYNSGMVLYSQNGAEHARTHWKKFNDYSKLIRSKPLDSFYVSDQPYLHAMIFATNMNYQIMDNKWNSYIHGTRDKYNPKRRIMDHRTSDTQFVHCQFPGADNMTAEQLLRVVNLPREEWNYEI